MFLVAGANGQLGNELKLLLQDKAVYVDRAELDITDAEAVHQIRIYFLLHLILKNNMFYL